MKKSAKIQTDKRVTFTFQVLEKKSGNSNFQLTLVPRYNLILLNPLNIKLGESMVTMEVRYSLRFEFQLTSSNIGM